MGIKETLAAGRSGCGGKVVAVAAETIAKSAEPAIVSVFMPNLRLARQRRAIGVVPDQN